MNYDLFVTGLTFGWVILEIRLGWINYKGCFKYKLKEGSGLWRWLDENLGVRIRIFLAPFLKLLIIAFMTSVLMVIFSLPIEVALASALTGMFIFVLDDVIYDQNSVETFEKCCLQCKSKRKCQEFLDKNCNMEFLKHRVKMAVNWKEE